MLFLIASDAFASFCNNTPAYSSTPNLPKAVLQATEKTISVCDLQNLYGTNQFPRFYWSLNKGLTQTDSQASILELAFDLAKTAVENNELETAEIIYQIILSHYPAESRAMSSYAAIHNLREEHDEAFGLLTKAISLSPNDTIILGNLYAMNMWFGHYERANALNRQLIKLEPNNSRSIIDRALFDKLYPSANSSSWKKLIQGQTKNKAYWEYFSTSLAKADQTHNYDDLISISNQWIDTGMHTEALLLLDYIASRDKNPTALFLKAKAFEQGKHYTLAYKAAFHTLKMANSMSGLNSGIYGSILYETARLAYAAKDYSTSLALLNEYRGKGYSHPHLDYMFAVNLVATGNMSEAAPHLRQCSTQNLPDNMQRFCNDKITSSNTGAATPDAKAPPSKATISLSSSSDSPSRIMQMSWKEVPVAWLGEIIDTQFTEDQTTLHVRWIAQHFQPTKSLEIEDGTEYQIAVEPKKPEELFIVDMYFGPTSQENRQKLRDSFTKEKEKYLIAQGHANRTGFFNSQLAAVVALERAIFTSKLKLIEQR